MSATLFISNSQVLVNRDRSRALPGQQRDILGTLHMTRIDQGRSPMAGIVDPANRCYLHATLPCFLALLTYRNCWTLSWFSSYCIAVRRSL